MLHDFQHANGFLKATAFDVIIVGSGMAGLALATALDGSGLQVLLVDGGGWDEQPALQGLYEGSVQGQHPQAWEFRRQRFGGTSHLWGGRCVPMDPLDLDVRPQVPHSGWPMPWSALEPFYEPACQWLDAGTADFSVQSLRHPRPLLDGLAAADEVLTERIERYSLPTDVGRAHRQRVLQSRTLHVLLHARATHLVLEGDAPHERVAGVEVTHVKDQAKLTLTGRQVVLAGGGIEATRLLLAVQRRQASWQRFDGGLGKFYTCHFDAIVGELRTGKVRPPFAFERTTDGVYARRKLQFTAAHQARHGLLNGTFRLHFPAYADARHGSGVLSTIFFLKSILPGEHQRLLNHGRQVASPQTDWFGHARNVLLGLPDIARFGFDWTVRNKLAHRKLPYTLVPNRNGSYPIEFNGEQIPDAGNAIGLLEQVDALGMPRVDIRWRITPQDVDSALEGFRSLAAVLKTHTQAELVLDLAHLREALQASPAVGGHHMGTTRMGHDTDPTSVVDAHLKVHGVANLSVCAASCMPTSGHANPTLTVVALAFRLAQHLKSTQFAAYS
ncbi:MAG TPA: GMC family oxidoreductase [Burkholderiaceae bacterium]|nr:GMC family oxidoreductase [Burkholderiaceae bacterium]